MTKAEFNAVFIQAVNELRRIAPKDTGHLAFNAIKGRWQNDNEFVIYIDSNVLINEPNGKGLIAHYNYQQRINEDPAYRTYKWFDKAVPFIARYIADRIGGRIE